jgi:hypothetical protein
MRYYKKDGKEFLENGNSKLRVTTMDTRPSPTSPGRVIKFLVVNEIIATAPTNPIRYGSVIPVSFPPEFVNANDYEWYRYGPEECQVAVKYKLNHEHKRN